MLTWIIGLAAAFMTVSKVSGSVILANEEMLAVNDDMCACVAEFSRQIRSARSVCALGINYKQE